jgi:hypothetical protein
MRALILVCLATFFAACRPEPRVIPPATTEVVAPGKPGTRETAWLQDTARSAQAAGAGPLQLLSFGSGTAGDKVDGFVHVPAGRCVLVYARSSGTVEDLDLHAYGDDGTPFGSDESPDDLPTLLLCPQEERRLFVAARVAQGHGLVALGVQLMRLVVLLERETTRARLATSMRAGPVWKKRSPRGEQSSGAIGWTSGESLCPWTPGCPHSSRLRCPKEGASTCSSCPQMTSLRLE